MDLADLGKLLLGKALRRANKRWPQAAMNKRDLAIDEAAHEDICAAANRLSEFEDLVAPWMRPPTSADGPACDRYRERRDWTGRRFEDDTVLAHERGGLTWSHVAPLRSQTDMALTRGRRTATRFLTARIPPRLPRQIWLRA